MGSDEQVKMKILRDTAAFDSLVESALPFSERSCNWGFHASAGHGAAGVADASAQDHVIL